MQKKGSAAIIISIVLVIAAMAVGIFVGFMIGRTYNNSGHSGDGNTVQSAETKPQIDTAADTETQPESILETEAGTADETEGQSAVVMTVGDHRVSMDEVNVRLYSLRSYYVQSYGEEPWGQVMEDGRTAAETAKDTLEADIIRAEIFMDKAADYGIEVTDTMKSMCKEEAENFMNGLGEDVTSEFGLTKEAVESVYVKYQVITEVTNAVNDQIRAELLADDANKNLDESELDVKISEAFQQQEEAWKAEYDIQYSDIWDNIVVGSVG